MAELKTGALSRAEIQAVWEGSVDKGYRDPLVRAGEGGGFEAWTQLFAQFERASKAIDVTTQAMFISPWSGQTNPPAAGGQKATVTLKVTRSKRLHEPLFLQAGLFVVEEETTDWGPGAGVVVRTGRRYFLAEDLYFAPGEQGPFEATFEAERFGYGYNNPLPGTIKAIEQKGSLFENNLATVAMTEPTPDLASGLFSRAEVTSWNEPDMFVPDHLGQYLLFSDGANEGKIGRIVEFDPPLAPNGSSVALDLLNVFGASDEITSYAFTNQSGDVFLSSTQNLQAGPTFQGDASKLGAVTFLLKKTGAPTGTAVAKVYALTGSWTTNSNTPTGPVLATSDPLDVATLGTSYAQVRLAFSGANQITLVNGTNYAIVLEYTGGNSTNNVGIGADSTAPTYPGFMTRFFSGSWSALAAEACFTLHRAYVAEFIEGETISFSQGTTLYGYGRMVASRTVNGRRSVSFVALSGTIADMMTLGRVAVGLQSGAAFTVSSVNYQTTFADEAPIVGVGGASWRILDWIADWGLEATNALSPENGKAAFLDELGNERAIGRSPGETDDSYRERVREIADVVTPNAIRRALNRALPGSPWSFLEVGQPGFLGFFYDGTNEAPDVLPHGARNDAYDVDTIEFDGPAVTGTFQFQEPVVLEDPSTWAIFVEGWMGRLDGTTMTVIRKSGWPPPSNSVMPRIRGLYSGATLDVTSAQTNEQAFLRRRRVWLNYTEFRGFFLVTMPPLSFGEFGFPYDTTTYQNNGFDIPSPWKTAYDGFPRLASDTYRRVWDAIEAARAGGVGWELRLDEPAKAAASFTYAYVPPISIPVLVSLNFTQADLLGGGQSIVATGTELDAAISCEVSNGLGGWTSASIVGNTSTSLAFTMPVLPGPTVPRFNGSSSYLMSGVASTALSTGAYSGWAVLNLDQIVTSGSDQVTDFLVGTDSSQRWGITFRKETGTVRMWHFNGALTVFTPAIVIGTKGLHLLQWDFDGATIRMRLDAGPWQTNAVGPIDSLAFDLSIGRHPGGTNFLSGDVHELALTNIAIGNTAHNDVAAYVAQTYGLSFYGITPSAFDPTSLSLTRYFRPGGYVLGTWTGVPSAGTSGSFNATSGSPPAEANPARAGTYEVRVTTAGGTSNTLNITTWDPTLLGGTTDFHEDYPGTTWTPRAGWRADFAWMAPGFVPAVGPGAGGFSSADTGLGGNSNERLSTDTLTVDNYVTMNGNGTSGSAWILFKPRTAKPDGGSGGPYTNAGLICTAAGGYFIVSHSTAGFVCGYYDGTYDRVAIPAAPGSWHMGLFTYDGSTMQASIAGSPLAPSAIAHALPVFFTGYPMHICNNYASNEVFDGEILAFGTRRQGSTDDDNTKLRAWAHQRFGIAA